MPTNIIPFSSKELITASVVMDADEAVHSQELGRILLSTCDKVRIFLLDGSTAPAWTQTAQVEVEVKLNALGGQAAAFNDCDSLPGYHLVLSPCYSYPPDFVLRMVQSIERYKRRAILGLAGGWRLAPSGYRGVPIEEGLSRDLPVHELQTDVLAYHVDVAHITRSLFGLGSDDLTDHLANWAQHYQIPLIMVKRPNRWVVAHRHHRPRTDPDPRYTASDTIRPPKNGWVLPAVHTRES